jgi:hypothetical protein
MTRIRRHKVASFRPSIEVLEARNLLSTFTVDHLADDLVGSGLNGSLRYCINNAANADTIQFSVTGTINLAGALPDLVHNVAIQGPGANLLTLRRDSGGQYSVLSVYSTVLISGLTITNGTHGIINAGQLTITDSTVSGNGGDQAHEGAGIYNGGELADRHQLHYLRQHGYYRGRPRGGSLQRLQQSRGVDELYNLGQPCRLLKWRDF